MTLSMDLSIIVNALIIVFFIAVLLWGYKKGLLIQVVGLVSTIASLFIAFLFANPLAKVFPLSTFNSGLNPSNAVQIALNLRLNTLIWFVIVFIVFKIIFMVIKPIINLVTKIPIVKQINSTGGMIFSVFVYYFELVLISFLLTFPIFTNGHDLVEVTWLKPISQSAQTVFSFIQKPFENNVVLQKLLSGEPLSDTEREDLSKILQDYGLSNDEIVQFLSGL